MYSSQEETLGKSAWRRGRLGSTPVYTAVGLAMHGAATHGVV